MKIALPVDEKKMDSSVCVSFGRAPYFLVYNSITNEAVYLNNPAAASSGGAGIKAAQAIADSGAQILVSPRCGENAANVLTSAKVVIYKSVPGTAAENIKEYLAQRLSMLNEIHKGFHGHAQK